MQKYKNILKNREDAAKKLFEVIPMSRLKEENWKLVAVSKAGLKLAAYIKGTLPNKVDFLFSEGIMAPNNDECEVARVAEGEEIVIHKNWSPRLRYNTIIFTAKRTENTKRRF